jgi:hypothetical protein
VSGAKKDEEKDDNEKKWIGGKEEVRVFAQKLFDVGYGK